MHHLTPGDRRVAGRTQRAGWMRPALLWVCLPLAAGAGSCRAAERAPAAPSTLQIGIAYPRSGGPGVGISSFVAMLTRESLISVGADGRPTPKLAAEWKTSDEGRRIRVRIHPNIRFHNNALLTAGLLRDLLLTEIRRVEAPLSYSSITDITAVDDDEIDIALSRPEAFLLTDLIVTSVTHPDNPSIGTGPYRPVAVDGKGSGAAAGRPEYARFEAFPAYYRGKVQTDIIDVKAYATHRNAWAALMRGEINALHEVNPGSLEFVQQESSVRTYSFLRGYYSFLAFNMAHPLLARRDVRQALSQAIDREQVIKKAMHGRGQPADGPIWPFHWAYSTAQRGHTYNPEAARLRLDAAGLTMPKTRVPGRMPSRLRFSCLILDDPRWEQIALVLQKQLFDIGVEMEIEARPVAEMIDRMLKGRFEAMLLEYSSGRSVGWTYTFWHSSNPSGYAAKTGYTGADRLLEELRSAITDQEIRASVGELQRTLYDDPPAIFIAWPYTSRAVSTAFVVPHESNTDVMANIWQWRAQPQVARK